MLTEEPSGEFGQYHDRQWQPSGRHGVRGIRPAGESGWRILSEGDQIIGRCYPVKLRIAGIGTSFDVRPWIERAMKNAVNLGQQFLSE